MELSEVHHWFKENKIFIFLKIKLLMNISFIDFKIEYFLIDND